MTSSPPESAVPQIPPPIVREIAQSQPRPGDFRARFPEKQPELVESIEAHLEAQGEVPVEMATRLAAALWAMYEQTLDLELPRVQGAVVTALHPVSSELLRSLEKRHPGEDFDAEWLAELPQGAQPHVIGFLVGALRATRLTFSGETILETATVLFAVAGALEATASRAIEATPT